MASTAITLPTSPSLLLCSSHAGLRLPSMSILRRLNLRPRSLTAVSAALRQDSIVWTQAPLSLIEPTAESLFHVSIDVSDSAELAMSRTRPGQYLQLRLPDSAKPSFLAIASPPSLAASDGVFEFLVKSVAGSVAELLCGLRRGNVVELTQAMGRGFDVEEISPPEAFPTLLIFATGSGIRIGLRIGNLLVLELYLYYHNLMIDGKVNGAMYRLLLLEPNNYPILGPLVQCSAGTNK
eukprot:TRINITY_DN536_c0_g1_i3.p1 TRINITY_DN536_c0_g1~~TRINITY_DN536_c0_g1_i3.p1  ORF type:complete len:237 (-),score=4.70 TRINITY_DN536_c0_g1_i3:387-1097(-)